MGKVIRRYYLKFDTVHTIKHTIKLKLSDALDVACFVVESELLDTDEKKKKFINELKKHHILFTTSDDKLDETVSINEYTAEFIDEFSKHVGGLKSCVADFMLKKFIELYENENDVADFAVNIVKIIRGDE